MLMVQKIVLAHWSSNNDGTAVSERKVLALTLQGAQSPAYFQWNLPFEANGIVGSLSEGRKPFFRVFNRELRENVLLRR